ncbi:hypothetical protein EVA_11268 [gut metagenome]|uniref:Uncharacterized protein n=1 Tax=gut metagenome TaxID=749906 RepID=J9CKP5_9ZZZZ
MQDSTSGKRDVRAGRTAKKKGTDRQADTRFLNRRDASPFGGT